MTKKIDLPRRTGLAIAMAFLALGAWWAWSSVGSTGELRPRSVARVLFPIWGNTAMHTKGYTWAREGERIVVDYEVTLEAGYFSITIGKTRWPYRRLLLHEQNQSFKRSTSGQMVYTVRTSGWHAIWAGRYDVWRGDARVRWTVERHVPARALPTGASAAHCVRHRSTKSIGGTTSGIPAHRAA